MLRWGYILEKFVFLLIYICSLVIIPILSSCMGPGVSLKNEKESQITEPFAAIDNIQVNSGVAYTKSTVVTVSFTTDKNIDALCLSEATTTANCNWNTNVSSPQLFTLSPGDGSKTISI